MKKAFKCRYLEAFVLTNGAIIGTQQRLVTRMDAGFVYFKSQFAPPFVPPVCPWYPRIDALPANDYTITTARPAKPHHHEQ